MDLVIKPADKDDLAVLDKYLPKKMVSFHADRIQEQEQGHILWLIIWLNNVPIGHAKVVWAGNDKKEIRDYYPNTPEIDNLYLLPEYRNKGYGTKIIQYIEDLLKNKGYHKLGLSVDIKNLKAAKLYEKLGFKFWPMGDFDASWEYPDHEGIVHKEQETCTYMIKQL
jgi:GNAT superfamily N-acetyltransferase